MNSRKGQTQEMVFLISVLVIAFVLIIVYVWLATQTSDKVTGSVDKQAMHIFVDDAISVWVKENMGRLASDPAGSAQALEGVLEQKGGCGRARCDSGDEGVLCEFLAFKGSCPVIPELLPSNEYVRSLVVPLDAGQVRVVVIKGRYE